MRSRKLSGKKANAQETDKKVMRRQETAYGDKVTICLNSGCALRKGAKCFGFEGCPGFKGR